MHGERGDTQVERRADQLRQLRSQVGAAHGQRAEHAVVLVQVGPVPDAAIGDFGHEIIEAGHQVRLFRCEVQLGAKLLAARAEVLAGHGGVPWVLSCLGKTSLSITMPKALIVYMLAC